MNYFIEKYKDQLLGLIVLLAAVVCIFRIASCAETVERVHQSEYWKVMEGK